MLNGHHLSTFTFQGFFVAFPGLLAHASTKGQQAYIQPVCWRPQWKCRKIEWKLDVVDLYKYPTQDASQAGLWYFWV